MLWVALSLSGSIALCVAFSSSGSGSGSGEGLAAVSGRAWSTAGGGIEVSWLASAVAAVGGAGGSVPTTRALGAGGPMGRVRCAEASYVPAVPVAAGSGA
ncbi:hypothetical protein ABZZ20_22615 [Streptomyces sp. NPDC006430]|uniref:hypothetical protein n=1 Tax=Streptomyces sp. NPDC006430 TaxID=3154299 RepID=UPI0033ABDE9C